MFQSVWFSLPLRGFICYIRSGNFIRSEGCFDGVREELRIFMLILFPCSLHVVHALNYATFSSGDGNFKLHWTYSNNKLLFNMTCKATGWCAVGFTENPGGRGMVNYDIAAGGVSANNTSYLEVSLYNVTGCTFR